MASTPPKGLVERPQLRERTTVFTDRAHAGHVLGEMLTPHYGQNAIVLGIPAGGVPVGIVAAKTLDAPFDLAVVSKITLPWNTEAGYGAVAFDGTVRLNRALVNRIGLSDAEVQDGIDRTMEKVRRRSETLRGMRPFPRLTGIPAILIDDGIASGFTLRVAVEALKKVGADRIVVAVPTAHTESIAPIIREAEAVFCPNLRSGLRFAVADAYRRWTDVEEPELIALLGPVFRERSNG